MPDVGFVNLFVVALVAFAVPLGLGLAPEVQRDCNHQHTSRMILEQGNTQKACPGPTSG